MTDILKAPDHIYPPLPHISPRMPADLPPMRMYSPIEKNITIAKSWIDRFICHISDSFTLGWNIMYAFTHRNHDHRIAAVKYDDD